MTGRCRRVVASNAGDGVRVLVVEDEPLVAQVVVRGLRRQGWAVDVAEDLIQARWLAGEVGYDVFVLDVHLPDGNGIDFCVELRARGDSTAIVLLTSQAEVTHRVHGLDSGADDFLAKPFSAAELAARLRALARRSESTVEAHLRVGDLVVDPGSRSVTRDGRRVPLAAREFALVHLLARTPGRPVTRHAIVEALWDFAAEPDANTLDVLVRAVRVKTRPALHRAAAAHRPRHRVHPPSPHRHR